jgi:hypothetical protein
LLYIKFRYMNRRWDRNIILSLGMMFALGLSAFSFHQVDFRAQGNASGQFEGAALRVVVEKYFAAYGKKDLAGIVALWSEKSPNFAANKQVLQQLFTSETSMALPAR